MKRIPTGIENFKELITGDYYYLDKSNLIQEILNEKVVLYTRPRRFGKTLNMSMLYYFFSNKEKENAYLFDGLKISKNSEALKYQNHYPTIFISLKEMKCASYDDQMSMFRDIIKNTVLENIELLSSSYVNDSDKIVLNDFIYSKSDDVQLKLSLKTISRCLYQHYHQKVMILIDEYDVPLQAAYQNNYYEEMVDFLRSVFSSSLKTNDALEKGIMSGCLRISKESIFTGLNNFSTYSILDTISDEYFGFTEKEVKQLLNDYHLSSSFDEVKDWYDGYKFGKVEIYNPWSTLSYVKYKLADPDFKPISFWANTSSNDLVMNYIQNGNEELHQEFEELIQGKSLKKYIKPDLTYREMDNMNNIYSFLLLTGYLKIKEACMDGYYELIIPNKEVYEIYKQSFMSYFTDYTNARKNDFYNELVLGNTLKANEILNDILMKSISYYDNEESFYHGFLAGLFTGYSVKSNREAGHGRFDLCILPNSILKTALVLECKHSSEVRQLVQDAKMGAQQIVDKKYMKEIENEGYLHVLGYGISFYKKQCYIVQVETM